MYIYIYIYICYGKKIFHDEVILFYTKNKSFRDIFISLVQQINFLQRTLSFPFLRTNSDTYEPIRQRQYGARGGVRGRRMPN